MTPEAIRALAAKAGDGPVILAEITVVEIRDAKVRLGAKADQSVCVNRDEIFRAIHGIPEPEPRPLPVVSPVGDATLATLGTAHLRG